MQAFSVLGKKQREYVTYEFIETHEIEFIGTHETECIHYTGPTPARMPITCGKPFRIRNLSIAPRLNGSWFIGCQLILMRLLRLKMRHWRMRTAHHGSAERDTSNGL
jgi:hypothetical protein